MYQFSIIELAGGKNAAEEITDTYWAEISYEQLLAWDPAYIILASDAAVKAAEVELLDVRLAMGLGGKGYCLMAGYVAAVEAAVSAGALAAGETGLLVEKVVIPGPAPQFWRHVL